MNISFDNKSEGNQKKLPITGGAPHLRPQPRHPPSHCQRVPAWHAWQPVQGNRGNGNVKDMFDPLKSGWKEEFYTTADWTILEQVSFSSVHLWIWFKFQILCLGQSLAAVDASTGDLLGVAIMKDRQNSHQYHERQANIKSWRTGKCLYNCQSKRMFCLLWSNCYYWHVHNCIHVDSSPPKSLP